MNILHLFSNWKWTGPAEHAVSLALRQQRAGHRVVFACAAPPQDAEQSIAASARRAGLNPVTDFRLPKHFHPLINLGDIIHLRRFLKQESFDIVHAHLPNDHLLAGAALRTCRAPSALVRTCYDGDGTRGGLRTRLVFAGMTDGLITVSERTRRQILEGRYLRAERIWKADVPVDIDRFDPRRVRNNRHDFHLSPDMIVGGIVARVQQHRRFEVLLEALAMVIREFPTFRFMIIGRGTHIQEIAVKPSQRMGIRTNLIFTGYRADNFPETLACLNFKLFLMPGSDGACRAVRESMAMGIPVIAANRGMLPEIITSGHDGLIVDDTPENLSQAMFDLIEHPERRREFGQNACHKARTQFNPEYQAGVVEDVYRQVLDRKRPVSA
jgi:glycosyltransferase involved in cell wall biosynthesis